MRVRSFASLLCVAFVGTVIAVEPVGVAAPPSAPVPMAPAKSAPSKATRRARVINAKTGWTVDLATDGVVSSNHFAPGKLDGDSLVLRPEGTDRAYRRATDGTIRHEQEIVARFDKSTVTFGDATIARTMTVAEDGVVTVTEKRSHGSGKSPEIRQDASTWRIEADDTSARRDALFVLMCEADAANPLATLGAAIGKSKVATAVVVGAAVTLVAVAAYRVMASDVGDYKRRMKKSK